MDRRRHKECLNSVKIVLSVGPRTAEIGDYANSAAVL